MKPNIVDSTGKKTSVILDIEVFEKLLEEIEDIYFGTLAKNALQQEQEFISHEEVRQRIKSKKA